MPVLFVERLPTEAKIVTGSFEQLASAAQAATDYCLLSGEPLSWKEALASKEPVCYFGYMDGEVICDKNKSKLLPTIESLGLLDEAESGLIFFATGKILRNFGSVKSFEEAILNGPKNKGPK